MSFFNDAQRDGLLTGRYICSECGGLMEYDAIYPTRDQICDD